MLVGICFNIGFLKDIGLEFVFNNIIIVDEYMFINDKDIYVVGDCVFVKNFLINKFIWLFMGLFVNYEGRICV